MPPLRIPRIPSVPTLATDDPRWNVAAALAVDHFHPASSDHRPRVTVRAAHDGERIHLRFVVADRYVVSRVLAANGEVCADSCVEFFVQPAPGLGYVNVEVNAGGTLHASCIRDHCRLPEGGFARRDFIPPPRLARIAVATTLPRTVDPEIPGPLDWVVTLAIPLALLAEAIGAPLPARGWRANFYKCADRCSHPHWAAWAPIGPELNFHQPERFGAVELDP